MKPPKLAEWLLYRCAGPTEKDNLLGDLSEEFTQQWQHNPHHANRWYWQQCLRSLAPLLGYRLALQLQQPWQRAVLAALLSVGLLWQWQLWISANAGWRLAVWLAPGDIALARLVYLCLAIVGVALSGRLAAQLASQHQPTARQSKNRYCLPSALAIGVLLMAEILSARHIDVMLLKVGIFALGMPLFYWQWRQVSMRADAN